jgi:hypothetical protein
MGAHRIANSQSKLLEILVGQVREHVDIDAVRSEELGVPAKTECLKLRRCHFLEDAPLAHPAQTHHDTKDVLMKCPVLAQSRHR